MPLCINDSGSWRNITTQCINQTGTWRKVVDGCINQSGTWRCYGMSIPTITLSASPSSIVICSGTSSTLTWSSTRATSVSSNFGASATSGTCNVAPTSTTIYCICATNAFGTSTTATATVTVTSPTLGSSFGGGTLICNTGSVFWVAAPASAQVNRSWTSRGDANTRAQQVSGCTGWFVPTLGQLQNPGYTCRTYWGPTTSAYGYWSNTQCSGNQGSTVQMSSGAASFCQINDSRVFARSFRCVPY